MVQISFLPLATGTEEGAAISLPHTQYGISAADTRIALTLEHLEVHLILTRIPVKINKIRKTCPSHPDCTAQNAPYGARESKRFFLAQGVAAAFGMEARFKQRFADIDIPEARHSSLIQKK